MISAVLVYLCTTTALDDCQVYLHRSWEGSAAPVECQLYLDNNETALPGLFQWPADLLAAQCESEPVGE